MYWTGGFCNTFFASLGMKFSTVIYPSLSVIIIATYNSSEFFSKQFGGIKKPLILPPQRTFRNKFIKFFLLVCLAFVVNLIAIHIINRVNIVSFKYIVG